MTGLYLHAGDCDAIGGGTEKNLFHWTEGRGTPMPSREDMLFFGQTADAEEGGGYQENCHFS